MRPISEAPRTTGQLLRLHPRSGPPFLGYWCRPLQAWVEDRGRRRVVREGVTHFEEWDERAWKVR